MFWCIAPCTKYVLCTVVFAPFVNTHRQNPYVSSRYGGISSTSNFQKIEN
jgi:hypothetical protein